MSRKARLAKTIKAQELWFEIMEVRLKRARHTCFTKMLAMGNQTRRIWGLSRSSNLCTEIVEYTAPDEIAVCNLASIALPRFVIDGKFDHQKLFEIT